LPVPVVFARFPLFSRPDKTALRAARVGDLFYAGGVELEVGVG